MSSEIILLIKVFDKEEYADAFINNGLNQPPTIEQKKRAPLGALLITWVWLCYPYPPVMISVLFNYY